MGAPLFELLLTDLPRGFVEDFMTRMQLVYAEAFESVAHDPRFGEPEVRYLHGHVRRALVEKSLRDIGSSHRMKVEIRRADGVGGPEHVMLSTGRFSFTCCYLPPLREFPQESRHREQYSLINEHAAQTQLFPIESQPPAHGIYGIIFHRESAGIKARLGTLSIGIPNEKCDGWLEAPISMADLADAQQRGPAARDSTDAPEPKWKGQGQKGNKDKSG